MPYPEQVRGIHAQVHFEYTDEEKEFLLAMQKYKEANRRMWPTWHEVLAVVRSLGYRRVAEPIPLPVFVTHINGVPADGIIAASGG